MIGVLGGTFDPVHRGHVAIAVRARQELALDRVLLLPTADPQGMRSLGGQLARRFS